MKKLLNLIAVALCAICVQAIEFDYDVNADGTITLSGVRGSVPSNLVIPSEIDGRAVTGIGAKFCEECDSLRSVKFPESIRAVADHGFDECNNLKSVDLNEGLLQIGRRAFCECPIETLELPSTLESVGQGAFTRSNIPGPLFSKSTSGLKSISIRYGDNSRFETCGGNGLYDKQEKRLILVSPYATSFRVPDGCEFIGRTALLDCGNLTSIIFPDSLTEIDDEAFAACVKLTNLDFSRTRLKRVSEQAFCGCIELISVSFPDTLVEIGGGAFCGDNKLQAVSFLGNAPYVNVDYEETSGKWGDLYIAIRDFKSGDEWVYDGYIKTVFTYVKEGATGWGAVPGTWQGRPIKYIGSPVTPAIDSSYGPFIPGEKVSLTIPALVGYTAKKLPSGLKLNKKTGEIIGAAKKPTGEAGVTVTFTKKNEPTLTAQFVVGPIPAISVTLEGDTEKCKVTGANKAYLVGKKVSLQAKGPKGTAFVGWFKDGEPWPSEEEFLEPKIKYVMTRENLNLVARFKAEEVSVACDTSVGCVVKEKVSFPVAVECESGLKSVSAKKLPNGLKYNKKTGCIEGAAKKAGTYPFSLTVTTKAGSKVTQDFMLVVTDTDGGKYPDWMVGTFSGGMKDMFYQDQEHLHFICADYAVGVLTVSPTGKCSMRWEGIDGIGDENDYFKPLTFSGEILDVSDSECHILITVPGGGDDDWIMTIRKLSLAGQEVGAYIDHFIPTDTGEYELDYDRFVQNIWVRQDMQGKLAEIGLAQDSGFAVSDLSGLFANTRVTVLSDGQVKLSGSVNGSSVSATGNLIPCDASVGAGAFESYFIVTAGKEHYPVKMLFVGQSGTWNVSAVDFDE